MPTRIRTSLSTQFVVVMSCASISLPAMAVPCPKTAVRAEAPSVDAGGRGNVDVDADADANVDARGRIGGVAGDVGGRIEGTARDVGGRSGDVAGEVGGRIEGDVDGRIEGATGDVGVSVDGKLPDVDAGARADADGRLRGGAERPQLSRPVGKWMWAGLGLTAGATAILFGTSMGLLGNLRGAMRDNLVAKAKLTLTDADPNNDIDINGDICAQARSGNNSAVTGLCDLGEVRRRAVIGTGITAGLLASVVIVLGVVIGVRLRRQCDDGKTALRRFNVALAPQLGGGMLVTGFRF
ncbi:hypothetical protein SAMN02745121_02825 [Nannocystis exedens]|uniref:Uncharacterized protein n=1 Tax=Nannocystis exedens TaxID=54 RepID=A0A1I1XFS3_9BACT|nr:hypothetical protein [Nannocystis exedens]PCC73446.1 hypothetical protein NAEX_06534 [Nannocystis exedens]SFE06162.1 hypothetical protein SAMN02745121_02825 [Nannocystis exedens]